MTDELNPQEGLSAASDRFPFVMVLTTTFLLGAMFLILNGPLIVLSVENRSFTSTREILADGVVPFWNCALRSGEGLFTGFLFLIFSLVVGLLLTPIDRGITLVFAKAWMVISQARKTTGGERLAPFTSVAFADPSYPAFLAWLMSNRIAKLHWEWELFNFYVFWGVFTNVAIFVVLAVFVQWPTLTYWEAGFYIILFLLFFGFAAPRCDVMARVNQHYRQQYANVSSPGAKVATTRHASTGVHKTKPLYTQPGGAGDTAK